MEPTTIAALASAIVAIYSKLLRNSDQSASNKYLASTDKSVEKLQGSLTKLESDVSELRSQQGGINEEQILAIVNELKNARNQVENFDNIIIPKDLNLRLVRADLLDRLDEYRSDQSVNFLMVGLFGGASSAIVVNWVTSKEISLTHLSVVLLLILLSLAAFYSYKAFTLNKRAELVKKRMLEEE